MLRSVLALLAVLALAQPVSADVTLKQMTSGKGLMVPDKAPSTTYIKGMKMRIDTVNGGTTQSMIFDVEGQKLYSFDSKKKEAEVWDMQALAAEMSKTIDTSDIKSSLKPNGQTKTIAGKTAEGYDLDVSMPTAFGGNKEMMMTVQMQGPVWVVKGAPGTEEYMAFYKAAAERGWIFVNPNAAKGSPGQARSMTEMYRQFAETGGLPYETAVQIKLGGSGGPMGGLLARMGNMSFTTVVEASETGTLAEDLFAPPAGYKLKTQK